MTWNSNYLHHKQDKGEKLVLITEETSLSFEKLEDISSFIVSKIPSRALAVVVCSNTIEAVAGYVGMLNRSVVPLLVDKSISQESFNDIMQSYKPNFVWCPQDFRFVGKEIEEWGGYHLVALQESPMHEMFEDLALLLSTSGSTGSKKYVRLSYENVASNAKSIIEYLGISPIDRAITTLPFSYSYGLSIINSHLMAGASLILTDEGIFGRAFWEMLKKYQATTFGGVPYTYAMLKRLQFAQIDIPSLCYITQAGGHLGEKLHREFASVCKEKGIEFIVMYGQTEATARLSYLPAEKALQKIGSIGKPIPGGEFKLQNDEGKEITSPGVAGELIYKGANVSLGYAESYKDLKLGDERHGLLKTGDVAFFDKDGYYYISGRKKRFLKVFGNRVNLDEVETFLVSCGYEAVCVGVDDKITVYVLSDSKEAVLKVLNEKTGLHRSAFRVKQIKEFPRNSSGKIQYSQLENSC